MSGRLGKSATLCLAVTAALVLAVAAEAKEFTIVMLPDTQVYTENDTLQRGFETQMRWLANSAKKLNVVFFSTPSAQAKDSSSSFHSRFRFKQTRPLPLKIWKWLLPLGEQPPYHGLAA